MKTGILLALSLAFAFPLEGLAQQPAPARFVWAKPNPVDAEARGLGPGFLGRGDRDHRYTGFWAGVGLGAVATIISAAHCSDPDNDCKVSRALLLGPVVTGVLGLTGALIGGLFPKAQGEPQQYRRALLSHWRL